MPMFARSPLAALLLLTLLLGCSVEPGGKKTAAAGEAPAASTLVQTLHAGSTAAQSTPTQCLWYADGQAIHQIATDTHRLTKTAVVQGARHVSTHGSDCGVWALTGKQLYQFDANAVQTQKLTLQSVHEQLAVDPFDNSAWVADGKTLSHFSTEGQLVASWAAPGTVSQFIVALDQSLWLLGKKQLWHYSAQGQLLASQDLHQVIKAEPRFLALDALGGVLWLAGEKQLTQLSLGRTGQPTVRLELPHVAAGMTLNPMTGEVWLIAGNNLLAYDRNGAARHTLDLTSSGLRNARHLAFDPVTRAIWVGTDETLGRFSAQGEYVLSLPTPGGNMELSAPAFLLTPTLSLIQPSHEAFINDPQPTVRYGYDALCNGRPCGFSQAYFGAYTLTLSLNQQPLGPFVFDPASGQATFIPASRLPEGLNTLVARATDGFGHTSNVVSSSFTIDTSAPAFTSLTPAEGSLTATPQVVVEGVVDDATATVLLEGVGEATTTRVSGTGLSFSFVVTLQEGLNTLNLIARDRAGNSSSTALHLTLDTIPPEFVSLTPPSGSIFSSPQVTIAGAVDDPDAMVGLEELAQWGGTGANPSTHAFSWTLNLKPGANTFKLSAVDRAGNVASTELTLTFTPPPPAAPVAANITLSSVSNGSVTVKGAVGAVTGGLIVAVTNSRTLQTVTTLADSAGGFTVTLAAQPGDVLFVSAVNAWGVASEARPFAVASSKPFPIPPPAVIPQDPVRLAPPLDPTASAGIASSTAFLYSGPDAIQTGVAPGTIEPTRVTVLRGRVTTRDNAPLPGVTITVLGHPELGQTASRMDGQFDMAANGGGHLTINYVRPGYLPAQRTVQAPWQAYVVAPDVVMIPLDDEATVINLNDPTPIQVARGSVMSDQDGTRQATLLFPRGTTATMVLPNGTTQELTSITVRATEYTVGANGPKAMPGELPPTSGYTYAVETSIDEAVIAGATTVQFNQPVYLYVENFLGFPVGGIVPIGYYDRQKAAWIASDNGAVIKVLDVANGIATVDANGDGLADNASQLAALNMTDSERTQLAALYAPGTSLWRSPLSHFTPWDCNWPYGPPRDAEPPNTPDMADPNLDKPDCQSGSIIECQNQSLGETVPVTGTGWSLNYRSSRVPGYERSSVVIPLSGATLPPGVKRIDLEVTLLSRKFSFSFPASPNLSHTFVWDRLDAYGRKHQGIQPAAVRIGYVYTPVYYGGGEGFARSFGNFGNNVVSGDRARFEITLWQNREVIIGGHPPSSAGLGGWTLSAHHSYDPVGKTLYLGDGRSRSARSLSGVVSTVAGTGQRGFSGDGGKATAAQLYSPGDLAIDAKGNLYIGDDDNNRVRKVTPEGVITTVAGNGLWEYSGDGGPATAAAFNPRGGLAVDAQGNLYIGDTSNHRIRKVSPDGIISTVAGNGTQVISGDGGPATLAGLPYPNALTIDPQGNLFVASYNLIRKISPDGLIVTVAGNVNNYADGDGGPALAARIRGCYALAVDAQGNLYIADAESRRIRKVTPDGIINTVAGDNRYVFSDDSGPATATSLYQSGGLAVDAQGNLYISDGQNTRIRKLTPGGTITTVVGHLPQVGVWGSFSGDGGPATAAGLFTPVGLAVDPQGSLYFVDSPYRVRKVTSSFPGTNATDVVIASDDGAQLYQFDSGGRHLRTVSSKTGVEEYRFSYNAAGLLSRITDGYGNVTTIERDSNGQATAIVAADGQRTLLTLDANGYLAGITNPAGEATRMAYGDGGLLTAFTSPRGLSSTISYDSAGRLIKDQDALGGFWELASSGTDTSHQVRMTNALGRQLLYKTDRYLNGSSRRTNTAPDGSLAAILEMANGTTESTAADGTITTSVTGPDPRFGMLAPFTTRNTVKTPSGLTATMTATREATLSNPSDLLSLQTQTDTVTANGAVFKSVYDATQRQYTLTTPMNRSTVIKTNARNRPLTVQVTGIDPVNYVYDSRGRLTSVSQGVTDARTVTYGYNTAGLVDSVTDALGRVTSYDYDAAGRVNTVTLPDNRVMGFTYDANGNVTSVTPPSRPAHVFGYDAVDQAIHYTPPALSGPPTVTRYEYGLDKQLTRVTRPDGQTVSHAYDAGGRLASLSWASGTIAYGYKTGSGQLESVSTPGGVDLAYSYDGSLLTRTTMMGPVPGSVSATYDNFFRVSGLGVNGSNVTLRYDNDGLLTSAGSLSLTRDARNGLVTGSTLGVIRTTQGHDNFGQVASFSARQGTTVLYSEQYLRDKAGRLTQKTVTVGGQSTVYDYGYDAAGRFTDVTKNGVPSGHFEYDANGNRTRAYGIAATYDEQDRLLSRGDAQYSHTDNGEVWEVAVGAQRTEYRYDVFGNLTQATLPDGRTVDYLVDGYNRRVGKKVNGTLTQGFIYQDQLKVAAELNGQGAVVSRFVYASQSNVPDYMVKGGVNYRFITDHLGSVRLVVSSSNGQVVQRIDYDEWGNVQADSNPGFQPFGFAGGLYDRDTGLVRFGARDYSPQTGRWMTKDPIGFNGQDSSLYNYAGGDPVNFIDPDGRLMLPVAMAIIGGISGGLIAAVDGQSITAGVVTGAISGATAGGGRVANAVIGAINGAIGYAISPGPCGMSAGGLMKAMGLGAVGGVFGRELGMTNGLKAAAAGASGREAVARGYAAQTVGGNLAGPGINATAGALGF